MSPSIPEAEPQTAYAQKNRGCAEGDEGLGLPRLTRLGPWFLCMRGPLAGEL